MKQKITDEQVLEILGTDPRYVSRSQIGWLSRSQIGGLSRSQIGGLSPDQIGGLSPDQIGGLSRSQIGWLSRSQIGGLSPDQIGGLSRSQIGWLSRSQIGGLSRSQIGGLSPECQEIIGLKNVPILENPYTKILEAVTSNKLEMGTWHTCNTAHCVGGWTVVLTPGGKELEAKFETATAAQMILRASRPDAPLPNFTASNEAAMAFIKARAKEESTK